MSYFVVDYVLLNRSFYRHIILDSVFWLESQFPTGRRVLFQAKKGEDGIIEWTPRNVNISNTGDLHLFIVQKNSVGLQLMFLRKGCDEEKNANTVHYQKGI